MEGENSQGGKEGRPTYTCLPGGLVSAAAMRGSVTSCCMGLAGDAASVIGGTPLRDSTPRLWGRQHTRRRAGDPDHRREAGGYVSRYYHHTDRHNYHGTENHHASQDKHHFVESRHVPPHPIESLIFFIRDATELSKRGYILDWGGNRVKLIVRA